MLRRFAREQLSQNTRRCPRSNDVTQVSGGVSPWARAPHRSQVITLSPYPAAARRHVCDA
jgi:hypothetical protein